ncbi:MAG: hypothetical protein ACRDDA_11720 [Aeromonas sp.]
MLHNDRLHKEMLENVAAAAKELWQEMDRKMPEAAVLAMQENLSLTAQFKHLSDRIEELLEENNALKVKEKQLKIKYKTMEPVVQEITRKNVTDQKMIQNLTEKCKQMKSELEKYNKLQTAHQRLLDKNTIVRLSFTQEKMVAVSRGVIYHKFIYALYTTIMNITIACYNTITIRIPLRYILQLLVISSFH